MKKLFFLSLLFSVLSCSNNTEMVEATSSSHQAIEVVVHRGANRLAPENTLAALNLAIEQGANYIEIDLASSADSVLYCFHDKTLERTTNGEGVFNEKKSDYIDQLDAGTWFSTAYKGEKIPRVSEILKMVNGRAKYYFDVKSASIDQVIDLIKREHLENECFVWFSSDSLSKQFRASAPELALKMNAQSMQEAQLIIREYNPQIIESNIAFVTKELIECCDSHKVKLMANLLRDSWWEYKDAIIKNVAMVNIDHPDYFTQVVNSDDHEFTDYRLVAHRGGIVENIFDEYDPQSLQAAIDSGYWMLEIDVQATADNQIIVHHDKTLKRIYGVDKTVGEMTLTELKQLTAIKGGYHPQTFEEITAMCTGKIRFMMDIKPRQPEKWFCEEIERILEQNNMLTDAYFIRNDIKPYFKGGKFGFRMQEANAIKVRLENGEDIASQYYMFDHGNRINAEAARWCQKNRIDVCASVNIGHYKMENHAVGANRDIEYLKKSGVTCFQIDSPYDRYFNLNTLK